MATRRVLVFIICLAVCNGGLLKNLSIKSTLKDLTKRLSVVPDFAQRLARYTLEEIGLFEVVKDDFNWTYGNVREEQLGILNFLSNLREINEHNLRHKAGLVSYTRSLSFLSDKSISFINEYMNGFIRPVQTRAYKQDEVDFVPPKTLNWVTRGFVTPVQNQKLCGSCWAFSAIAAIEGQMFNLTKKLTKLSEQNLIDCNRNDEVGNYGCKGGDMITAFNFIIEQKGVAMGSKYSYKAADTFDCGFRKSMSGATLISYETIESGNERLLQALVAKRGPVAIAIDASLSSFQSYKSGIYYDPKCSKEINHAVLLCGYGTEKNKDYWLVKNSYGDQWGDKGFIKIARNAKNHCGIAEFPVVPVCKVLPTHKVT